MSLQHWFRVGAHAWCHLFRVVPAKFKTGMCEMKIFGLKFVVCLGTLVQDGLAHMRGVTWRAVPAKFETGMCEIKSLGSEVLWCVFATLVQGWHRCVVSSVPSCSGRVQNRDV